MIIIVGLGNPGKKYEKTRHNAGFMVLDKFAKNINSEFKKSEKFESEIAEATLTFPGEKKHVKILLAKPQTFMNESGRAVSKLVNFYKIRPEDQLWVVHDDLDINLGTVRIILSGSSAGQKGVKSIIEKLGTDKFVRFRIGIKPQGTMRKSAEDFVLNNFTDSESKIISSKILEIIKQIKDFADRGVTSQSI